MSMQRRKHSFLHGEGDNMDNKTLNEVANDLLVVKEQEAFFRSKGTEAPATASSVAEAEENLKRAEAELYRK